MTEWLGLGIIPGAGWRAVEIRAIAREVEDAGFALQATAALHLRYGSIVGGSCRRQCEEIHIFSYCLFSRGAASQAGARITCQPSCSRTRDRICSALSVAVISM